jgi:hypothetical protein
LYFLWNKYFYSNLVPFLLLYYFSISLHYLKVNPATQLEGWDGKHEHASTTQGAEENRESHIAASRGEMIPQPSHWYESFRYPSLQFDRAPKRLYQTITF